MSAWQRIACERDGNVVVITLCRPDKRNALDDLMVAELKQAFTKAEASGDSCVVLLRGAGPDFCTGADLEQLERIAAGGSPLENVADAAALGDLFSTMRRMSKPIIAAVHGHALAGGAGLASACDIVLASDDAIFGYPEVRLGFVPAMVMALLRRQCGEKHAFELVAHGDRITAADAQRLGLVNRLFRRQSFDDDARAYAAELASRPAAALRLIKRLFYGMDEMGFDQAIARGAEVNALARMGEETRAGVREFLQRRRGDRA